MVSHDLYVRLREPERAMVRRKFRLRVQSILTRFTDQQFFDYFVDCLTIDTQIYDIFVDCCKEVLDVRELF